MEYIRSIQPLFYDFGICRIQPPESWNPPKCFHRPTGRRCCVPCCAHP